MAGKGRWPTPTGILKLRGSKQTYKRKGEPEPQPGVPDCPVKFTAAKRAAWAQVCERLRAMNVLTLADADVVSWYASLLVEWDALRRDVELNGQTEEIVSEKAGTYTQIRAAAKRHDAMLDRLIVVGRELGLTPSARTRIRVEAKPARDAKAKKYFGSGA